MEPTETKTETQPTTKPSLSKLAAALAKAQGAMANAKKDIENPFFKSKYADLAGIWDVARGPLSANGLCIVQRPTTSKDSVTLITTLLHESGEEMSDTLVLPVGQFTPQGISSAITYARRIALGAMVGVASEADDDGNAASQGASPARQQYDNRKAAKPTPTLAEQTHERKMPPIKEEPEVTDLHKRIVALLAANDIKGNEAKVLVTRATGKVDRTKLVEDDYARIEAEIIARKAEDAADVA